MQVHIAKVTLFLTLSCLILGPDWQAGGRNGWFGDQSNNLAPNLPKVRQEINKLTSQLTVAFPTTAEYKSAVETLSASYEALWDKAWNVVIIKLEQPTDDAVLYGYAYKQHWYWHNNYLGLGISIIIWKDYNCIIEHSFASNTLAPVQGSDNTEALDIQSRLTNKMNNWATQFTDYPNIWPLAQKTHELSLQQRSSSAEFSVVAVPSQPAIFAAKFCYSQFYMYMEVNVQLLGMGFAVYDYIFLGFDTRQKNP